MLYPDADPQKSTYAFESAGAVSDETTRLDELHVGITKYLGNRLCFADLKDVSPTTILEIGSGSGAWAIQAAELFPQSRVLAIDRNFLPSRPFPPNVDFQNVDITKPYPFEEETFDVIHARFVMMHVANGEDAIKRCIPLLKPGGLLILEDPDDDQTLDRGNELGPGMATFMKAWLGILRSRGAEPCIGRRLGEILNATGAFSAINVHKVVIPYGGRTGDSARDAIGEAWMKNALRVAEDLSQRFSTQGITVEVANRHLEELQDPERHITTDMYFTWARKFPSLLPSKPPQG